MIPLFIIDFLAVVGLAFILVCFWILLTIIFDWMKGLRYCNKCGCRIAGTIPSNEENNNNN